MTLLRELRESFYRDIGELANKIGVDPEEISAWESGLKALSKQDISTLAYVFGLSSEELTDYLNGHSTKLTTNMYHYFGKDSNLDGWWGHVGVCLKSKQKTKWFPISIETANLVSSVLVNINSKEDWLIIDTLNNRTLAVRPALVKRIWLLDEGADETIDWSVPRDGYGGKPGEFYKGLEAYCFDEIEGDECEISMYVKQQIEDYTDAQDIDTVQAHKLVSETNIYDTDDTKFGHIIGDEEIRRLITDIECEVPVLFNLSNENAELYLSSENIVLIDMPKRRVDMALREELERVNDEN